MREQISLNDKWEFAEEFSDAFLKKGAIKGAVQVRIPHTVKELPYHYFDDALYQMLSGYRRIIHAEKTWEGKRVFVRFMAVAHEVTVYLNGEQICEHRGGYTAFEVELTDGLKYGEDNILSLKVDSRESLNVPPFGNVIDYMTYGGIYREVYLYVCDKIRISEFTVLPQDPAGVEEAGEFKSFRFNGLVDLDVELDMGAEADESELSFRYEVRDHKGGAPVVNKEAAFDETEALEIPDARLWDVKCPNLYDIKISLCRKGEVIDTVEECFGFRKSEFIEDGYYLNGRKLKLRGLNRHQSYAYTGYAMPASMQRLDAEILRFELGLNAVRTSHYPQSQHFIRRCDELGLLVFTEMPGWQYIGDQAWKEQAFVNLEEMIVQYRNHPSVILWGVRINESVDDDDFYEQTNAMAHALDPTRPTGGVRYIEKSHLLEDVYTFNDFSHDGSTPGCKKKASVTPDASKPYLISEYNGHMFPTKSFDCEEHRLEHALRHCNVLESVNENRDIAGAFGWCMFDYNTHKDFGSGDRICYHGVMDMFRNPKMAAYVYASQQKSRPVLEVSSSMDIGEHPGGNKGEVFIFTNADSVKMYRNDELIKEYTQADPRYRHMRFGPMLIDDYVGDRMKEEEGFGDHQNEIVKTALNYIAQYGLNNLPVDIKVRLAEAMTVYHMSFETAYALYGKYVGNWGGKATTFKFEAIKDGKVVRTIIKSAVGKLTLDVRTDHTLLTEGDTYDVAAVRIRVCDEHGNVVPFFNTPLKLTAEGPIEIIGPAEAQIAGGMGGTYVKTTGKAGMAKLKVSLPDSYSYREENAVTTEFEVRIDH